MATEAAHRIPNPILPVLGINVGASFVVIFASDALIDRLSRNAADRALHAAVIDGILPFFLTYVLAAVIPSLFVVWQLWPLVRASRGEMRGEALAAARRCALRVPLAQAGLTCLGWTVGLTGFFVSGLMNGVHFTPADVASWSVATWLRMLLCFALAFYVLEYVMRRVYIPRLFPEGRLAELSQGGPLSIPARFFIFYFAICAFPVFLAYSILRAQLPPAVLAGLEPHLELALLGVLGLSALLTWVVSTSYQQPLVRMKRAVGEVRKGNYGIQVAVTSDDEVGTLGDGINEMAVGLLERERIKSAFGRAVAPAVRDHLLRGNLELGGELREATVLFSDIRGFTTLSERMRPPEVVALLNRYFERVSRCIEDEGGVVNKYIGDAVMALFGVPVQRDDAPAAAVRAALRMREQVKRLNEELAREGVPPLRTGTGIHHGALLAGNIGSPTRMEYTVIGDVVNLASRIEGLCKEYACDLIVSASVRDRLGADAGAEFLAARVVRGRAEPVELYRIPE